MFSTLKRRVKKMAKKVEEFVDKDLCLREKMYDDFKNAITNNKIATGVSFGIGGLAIAAWFIISELTSNKRGDYYA